ncbi:MAG: tripartite tricarboxylate transporter substrate binding protein [Burkholderiales bacterium]|nr:tripartite tricarboxylate transporter substrate binding protein [Burkholderiales bacterium]
MSTKPMGGRGDSPIIAGAVSVALLASPIANAQEASFPTKPIRLIVASAPGGPNDVVARIVATPWSDALGRPIVTDNRAGAAGLIGTELGAKAPPDGYTLLLGFQGPLVIAPNLNATVPYDTLKDFAPVSLAVSAPFVLLVNLNIPAMTGKELVAFARARRGKLNFASGGAGTGSHMSMEVLKHVAGIDAVHVAYKGAGPGMTALVSGEVDMMLAGVGAALPHVNAKRLRAVAIGGDKRSPLLPNVPTLIESGYAVNASSWYGMLAPAATPPGVVAHLHQSLVRVLNGSPAHGRFSELGFNIDASTPLAFSALIRDELRTWRNVIAAAGLKSRN